MSKDRYFRLATGARYLNAFLNVVYPTRCPICKSYSVNLICDNCFAELDWITSPICRYCGKPTLHWVSKCRSCQGRRLHFDTCRSLYLYRGRARDLVKAFKYKNQRRLALLLGIHLAKLVKDSKIDKITWVPASKSKSVSRGYNQSKILAQQLARYLDGKPTELLGLKKTTSDQSRLNFKERQKNVKDAFCYLGKFNLNGARVVIVDDVYTTGSTVSECSRILRVNGAGQIQVVTVARTLLD
jgi:ComF family protein